MQAILGASPDRSKLPQKDAYRSNRWVAAPDRDTTPSTAMPRPLMVIGGGHDHIRGIHSEMS